MLGTPLTVAKPPLAVGTWQVQEDAGLAELDSVGVEHTAPSVLSILMGPMAVSAHTALAAPAISRLASASAVGRCVLRLPRDLEVSATATHAPVDAFQMER